MRDIYQEITETIIAALEAGITPWHRPWRDGNTGSAIEPHNAATGRPYSGINLLVLGIKPYSSLGWLTFKQALELGGNVRKGEKGTTVVFWKFEKREQDGVEKIVPFARAYTVFNVEQCENLTGIKAPAVPEKPATDIFELSQRVGCIVRHGGARAFYSPSADFVQMPAIQDFKAQNAYDATLAHEMTHWTGHENRCKREFGKRFGDSAYAFEELVAEIGSAFLCARMGIEMAGLQHANYVGHWLSILKADKRAIFTAASKAKEAAGFLLAEREELEMSEAA